MIIFKINWNWYKLMDYPNDFDTCSHWCISMQCCGSRKFCSESRIWFSNSGFRSGSGSCLNLAWYWKKNLIFFQIGSGSGSKLCGSATLSKSTGSATSNVQARNLLRLHSDYTSDMFASMDELMRKGRRSQLENKLIWLECFSTVHLHFFLFH